MLNLPAKLKDTYKFLEKKLAKTIPTLLITLGSGQGEVLKNFKIIYSIPFHNIPGIPESTVQGHSGILEIVEYNNNYIAIMRGRLHSYELNISLDDLLRIQKALAILGLKYALLTNASGSLSLDYKPGTFVLLNDHINLTGLSPLISNELLETYFLDQSAPYNSNLNNFISNCFNENKITYKDGVYAWIRGPQYETKAEVKMLKLLGSDLVGMSTVPEVITLNYFKVKVSAISLVTNYGCGLLKDKILNHQEVQDASCKASKYLDLILNNLIKKLYL